MTERSIAPSPRRLREAWTQGIRARSRWLGLGSRCLALWVLLAVGGQAAGQQLAGSLRQALRGDPWPLAAAAVGVALPIGLALVLADVLAAALSRELGPIRSEASAAGRRGLTAPVWGQVAIGSLGLWVGLASVLGVVAGAARGVDASAAGLEGLYVAWGGRLLGVGALIGIAAGFAERWLAGRRRRRALFMSVEEAREEQRRTGPAGGRA